MNAGQHLYASVEADRSPSGRGGFQTLLYTRAALSESEVAELESRLPYYPSTEEPVKRLFFTLTSGKVVVSQIAPLSGADSAGRKGRYLAHSLLFDADEFLRAGGSPFIVFDAFDFAAGIDEALSAGDPASGDMPPVAVNVSAADEFAEASAWSPNELRKLALLATRARRLAEERTPVAFVGSSEEVDSALRAAWFALPRALRLHCSFDTYFHRCNLVATYYWGIGLLTPPANPNLPVVRAADRQVSHPPRVDPQDSYDRWLVEAQGAGGPQRVATHREPAYAVAWLLDEGADSPLLDDAPAPVVEAVLAANQDALRRRLQITLAQASHAALAERVLSVLLASCTGAELLPRMRAGFPPEELQQALWRAYRDSGFGRPSRQETDELGRWLQQHPHPRLNALHACWTGEERRLPAALSEMKQDEYAEFVGLALAAKLARPQTLISASRAGVFVDAYVRAVPARRRDLAAVAEALLECDRADSLDRLAPAITGLPARNLRRLHALIRRDDRVSVGFRRRVAEAMETHGGGGLRRLLKRLTRRK